MDNPKMETTTQIGALSEIFKNTSGIILRDITSSKITYFENSTTNLPYLAGRLQEVSLLQHTECAKLNSFSNDYEKSQYLYNDVLNKRVERQGDYEKLIGALRKSGNSNIADEILKKLETFKSPDVVPDITNENAHMLPDAPNSEHSERNIVGPDPSNGSQNVVCAALLFVVFSVVLMVVVVTVTHIGNRLSSSSGMNITTFNPLKFSPGNPRAEDDSRYVKSIPTTDPLHAKNQLTKPSSVLNLDASKDPLKSGVNSRLEDDLVDTGSVLAETITRPQSLEMLTVKNSVESLQHSLRHQQSDVKNISTTDPLQVKISGDHVLPKPSSTESSQKQLPTTPPPQELIDIEIGSPLDKPHLPGMKRIHLNITNASGADWRNWTRDNAQQAEQVSSLRLKGTVSPVIIRHFLSSFKNLTSLWIESLTGKLCGKLLNFKSDPLSHDHLEYLGITHVEDNPCRSAYQFFNEALDFPKLRSVEIVNLPIVAENEKFFREFFKKIETQLKQLYLQNVSVRLESHAFADSEFKKLVSLYSVFTEPASEGAKSVFTNLNRATPNLVEISTNVECTKGEKFAFDKNWSKINGSKRMICDLRSSK